MPKQGFDHRGLRFGDIPRSVDSISAFLHNSLFPADEHFFTATPVNAVANRYKDLYEAFKTTNLAESNFSEIVRQMMMSLCIDDAVCVGVHWQQQKRKKTVYEAPRITAGGETLSAPLLGMKPKVACDQVTWEGTQLEVLNFTDWRVDSTARDLASSWFMRRWYAPVHEVKATYGLASVVAYQSAWESSAGLSAGEGASEVFKNNGLVAPIGFEEELQGREQALLMICYDDFVIEGKVYANHYAVVLNGQQLVAFGENPYAHGRKPYLIQSYHPLPNQIYGMAAIRHAIPSAALIDTLTDHALRISDLAANPIFEVDYKEPFFQESREVRPGMTCPVKRPGQAIRQIPINVTNLNLILEMIQQAKQNIRETTGAVAFMSGDDLPNQSSNMTAFQVDQHVQGSNSRFLAVIKNLTNGLLEPYLQMAFENDQQYKSCDEYVAGFSEPLTPDLIRQMDFKWVVTSAQASNTRGRQLNNMKSLLFDVVPKLVDAGVVTLDEQKLVFKPVAGLKQLMVRAGMGEFEGLFSIEGGDSRE
jgi:hypothetical protein